jgi:hypothetical protein
MRLQVHATDPARLEPRLGQPESKGCIRIPATLNRFIDRYGLLDADYNSALAEGRRFWVLRPERVPTPWSGRWLVVVDSLRVARPEWSPAPPRSWRPPRLPDAPTAPTAPLAPTAPVAPVGDTGCAWP